MFKSLLNLTLISSVALGSFACAPADDQADGQGPETPQAAAPTKAEQSPTEHVIALGRDHNVVFHEVTPGVMAVVENGKIGEKPVLVGDMRNQSPEAIWNAIEPNGAPAPAAVVAASVRLPASSEQDVDASELEVDTSELEEAPASAPISEGGEGNAFYNDADHEWFRQHFCLASPSMSHCIKGWNWATSTSGKGGRYESIVMNGSEATAPANYNIQYRKCVKSCGALNIICDTNCYWQQAYRVTVQPGWWSSWAQTKAGFQSQFGGAQYAAVIDGNPNAVVSLSATWYPVQTNPPPPTAPSHRYSWTCQCNTAPTVLYFSYDMCLADGSAVAAYAQTLCQSACWPAPAYQVLGLTNIGSCTQ